MTTDAPQVSVRRQKSHCPSKMLIHKVKVYLSKMRASKQKNKGNMTVAASLTLVKNHMPTQVHAGTTCLSPISPCVPLVFKNNKLNKKYLAKTNMLNKEIKPNK